MIYALLTFNIILSMVTLAVLILSNAKPKQQTEVKQEQTEDNKTEDTLIPVEDENASNLFELTKTLQHNWYNLTSDDEGE